MAGNSWGGSSATIGYRGTRATSPVNITYNNRNPGIYDTQNVVLGDQWLNEVTNQLWTLISLGITSASPKHSLATWVEITSSTGTVLTLTSNDSIVVPPTGTGTINVVGDGSNIVGAGNAATSTVTFNLGTDISVAGTITAGTGITLTSGILNLPNGAAASTSSIINVNGSRFLTVTDQSANIGSLYFGTDAGNPGIASTVTSYSTAMGTQALANFTSGGRQSAFGYQALTSFTSAGALTNGDNCAFGYQALGSLLTGKKNICIGTTSGTPYTGAESNNILISSSAVTGVTGENNVMRLGDGQTQTFIAGIAGVTVANTNVVTINTVTGQMGSQAASTGISTLDGNTGSATGSTVSVVGAVIQSGASVKFTGSGSTLTINLSDANQSTYVGGFSGGTTPTGTNNLAAGFGSMAVTTTALDCVGLGAEALNQVVSSEGCTAVGSGALGQIVDGDYCVGIGIGAGESYTSNESSNICINSDGATGESHTLRIGQGTGTGVLELNQAFISGIQGITVTGAAVLVSAADQLGIAVSSERYKENICKMPSVTHQIMALNPVTFTYKEGSDKSTQYGLIAEHVQQVMPQLVIMGQDGLPQTVKYHDLPVLLLKEIQQLRKELDALKKGE